MRIYLVGDDAQYRERLAAALAKKNKQFQVVVTDYETALADPPYYAFEVLEDVEILIDRMVNHSSPFPELAKKHRTAAIRILPDRTAMLVSYMAECIMCAIDEGGADL